MGSCQIVSSKNESQDGLDTSCSPCKVHYHVHGSGTFLTRVAFVPIVHRPTPHAPGTRPAHFRPTSDPHQVLTPCELSYLRPLTILTPLKLSQLTFHIRLNRHIFSFSPNSLGGNPGTHKDINVFGLCVGRGCLKGGESTTWFASKFRL